MCELLSAVKRASLVLLEKKLRFATAESCTGGQIASHATTVPGASQWFEVGFVTYSNQAKITTLGVKAETLDAHTAISAEVAKEMVSGALDNSCADVAIAVTGLAGPHGDGGDTPVGVVYIALQLRGSESQVRQLRVYSDRVRFQRLVAEYSYEWLYDSIR